MRRKRLPATLRRIVRPRLRSRPRSGPVSAKFGYDRGTPVDRYYIDAFLAAHKDDITGNVLEVKDASYARRYGSNISRADVLDIDPANAEATIVVDLASADPVPDRSYTCILLTQVLQFVPDTAAAIRHLHRILDKPGVLLATVPGLQRVETEASAADLWRFTPASCRALFSTSFGADAVTVEPFGNAQSAAAAVLGLAAEELSTRELEAADPRYPVVVAIRAWKT